MPAATSPWLADSSGILGSLTFLAVGGDETEDARRSALRTSPSDAAIVVIEAGDPSKSDVTRFCVEGEETTLIATASSMHPVHFAGRESVIWTADGSEIVFSTPSIGHDGCAG